MKIYELRFLCWAWAQGEVFCIYSLLNMSGQVEYEL